MTAEPKDGALEPPRDPNLKTPLVAGVILPSVDREYCTVMPYKHQKTCKPHNSRNILYAAPSFPGVPYKEKTVYVPAGPGTPQMFSTDLLMNIKTPLLDS
jgi:hypothetical protein